MQKKLGFFHTHIKEPSVPLSILPLRLALRHHSRLKVHLWKKKLSFLLHHVMEKLLKSMILRFFPDSCLFKTTQVNLN